jgi:TonB family protein
VDADFRLLSDRGSVLEAPRRGWSALGSVLTHIALAVFVVLIPWGPKLVDAPDLSARAPIVIPLIAPPPQLTQTDPNTRKPSLEVNLQGLLSPAKTPMPREQTGSTQPAAPKQFQAPPVAAPPAPKPAIEAPQVTAGPRETGDLLARNLPGIGTPSDIAAPPQIQAEEKPKLAFEKPGADSGRSSGMAASRVPAPKKSSVEDAMKQVALGGGGGLVVGDLGEGTGGLGESLNAPAVPRNGSNLELLSDPQGVDFRPYLIRILSTVRRNWLAVIPESARFGRRGKVQIQFAINKDGGVPKLVIALPSGTESLDRAAVAGVSASNPFPPLPAEFKGQQVRLQFTFLYNMGRQ